MHDIHTVQVRNAEAVAAAGRKPEQPPEPCTYPCESDDTVARQKVIAQLQFTANLQPSLDAEKLAREFNDRYQSTSGHPHLTVQGAAWLIGWIGSAHTTHAVNELVEDARDFNDIVEAYDYRRDPGA